MNKAETFTGKLRIRSGRFLQLQEKNEGGNMDLLGDWTVEADQVIVY